MQKVVLRVVFTDDRCAAGRLLSVASPLFSRALRVKSDAGHLKGLILEEPSGI
jgi:hypothetical protein